MNINIIVLIFIIIFIFSVSIRYISNYYYNDYYNSNFEKLIKTPPDILLKLFNFNRQKYINMISRLNENEKLLLSRSNSVSNNIFLEITKNNDMIAEGTKVKLKNFNSSDNLNNLTGTVTYDGPSIQNKKGIIGNVRLDNNKIIYLVSSNNIDVI